jgi:DNA-binding transcriptional ArsR family regulator
MNRPLSSKVVSSPAAEVPLAGLASAAAEAATLLKALANPDRLLLLCSLVEGECNVSALETVTGIRQPTLSQQLGVLRDEGLVGTRREGKFIYYRIDSAPALAVLQTLYETFCRPVKTACAKRRRSTPQEPRR